MYPVRLNNYASLKIGHNFIEIDGFWWIVLSAAETKEKRLIPLRRHYANLITPNPTFALSLKEDSSQTSRAHLG
jgi:hypothetical protein